LPSVKGELANSAVATGWSARLVRNFSTMSASERKSRLACTVQVRSIMSRPSPPTLGMYERMMSYRPLGITGTSSRRHSGENPSPMKPIPSSSATVFTSSRCRPVSLQIWWMSSSGAPDSSNCPPGSRLTDAPSRSSPMIGSPCRLASRTSAQPKRVSPVSIASMPWPS
jgi:hypothetical protein